MTNSWINWSVETVGGFLTAIHDHLPNADAWFPGVLFTFGIALLAGPGVAGFLGAWRWGAKVGLAGVAVAYLGGLWFMMAAIAGMTRCRPEAHCAQSPEVSGGAGAFEFIQWAAGAYAVSWFWHLLWIGFGLGCLYGGLVVRRRRLRRIAQT